MMDLSARLPKLAEDNCRAVIDGGHDLTVEAIHGPERRGLAVSSQPRDEGLLLGAPGRQGADPHGHQRLAAVLEIEKPFPAAVTRGMRRADESAMAGEGVPHD
jgi:hypothetical protein